MNLSNRTVNATRWQLVSVVTQAVLQVAVLSVLARYVAPEEFGVIAIANIFIMLATVLTLGSIRPAIIQNNNITNEYIRVAFTFSLILGALFTLILYSTSGFVAEYFENEILKDVLIVISISFLLNSFGLVSEALIEKSLGFKKSAISNIVSYSLGYSLPAVLLSVNGYGIWALAIAVVSQSAIKNMILYAFSRHSIKPLLSIREFKLITVFSTGSMSKWLFNYIALQADNFIVGKVLGASALGFYSMAFTAMDLPRRFLANIVEKVLLPSLSIIQDDNNRFTKASIRAYESLNTIMMPISVFLLIIAEDIVMLLLGDKWTQVVIPLQIMLLQIPLRTTIRVSDVLTTAKGVLYKNAVRKFIYASVVIVFALIGSEWGLVGVSTAVTLAVVVHFIMVVGLGISTLGLRWKDLIVTLLPGLKLSILVLFTVGIVSIYLDSHILSIILSVIAYMLVHIAVLIRFPYALGESSLWMLNVISTRLKPGTLSYKLVLQSISRFQNNEVK